MFQQLILTTYKLPPGMGECNIISETQSTLTELAVYGSNPKNVKLLIWLDR